MKKKKQCLVCFGDSRGVLRCAKGEKTLKFVPCTACAEPVCPTCKGTQVVPLNCAECPRKPHMCQPNKVYELSCPTKPCPACQSPKPEPCPKCKICDDTGKPCESCGEFHSPSVMCPPHEVRMKGKDPIDVGCPECGTTACQSPKSGRGSHWKDLMMREEREKSHHAYFCECSKCKPPKEKCPKCKGTGTECLEYAIVNGAQACVLDTPCTKCKPKPEPVICSGVNECAGHHTCPHLVLHEPTKKCKRKCVFGVAGATCKPEAVSDAKEFERNSVGELTAGGVIQQKNAHIDRLEADYAEAKRLYEEIRPKLGRSNRAWLNEKKLRLVAEDTIAEQAKKIKNLEG